jgi:tetratricopeptide (TPR) repeat protein
MRFIVAAGVLWLSFTPLYAAPFADYDDCIAAVSADAKKALPRAEEWSRTDGDAPAEHCVALALSGLKRYREAAAKLDLLAKRSGVGDYRSRAALYNQAGNAWLLAGKAQEADRSFSAALRLTPDDAEMRADRARARAVLKNWSGAETDLSVAVRIDQNRADLLSLRAAARRHLGRKEGAATDILRALTIYPDYPAALIQRGAMRLEVGDINGARRDWQKVAQKGDDTAAEAKRLLAALPTEQKPPRKK